MDQWIWESAERAYQEKRRRTQYSRTCNACKKKFPSGNKLFRHLSVNPKHRCELYEVTYVLKCTSHPGFEIQSSLNVWRSHTADVTEYKNVWGHNIFCGTECKNVYVDSIQITPYYREAERYTITDFDMKDLLSAE